MSIETLDNRHLVLDIDMAISFEKNLKS